jgi:hypothetical protein
MTGCLLDNANKRLWIRPMIPSSMAKKITSAPILNPRGWGTLTYDENADAASGRFQNMTVAFDSLTPVKEIVLKNNTGVSSPGVAITNNGSSVTGLTVTAEGSGFEKNIRVALASPIQVGPQGATIRVYNTAIGIIGTRLLPQRPSLTLRDGSFHAGKLIQYTVDVSGPFSMDLIGMNGAAIGKIAKGIVAAGTHAIQWNGKTLEGNAVGASIAMVRLTSLGGVFSKIVYIAK